MPVTTIRGGRQITDGTIPYVDIQQVAASRLVGNPTVSAATMSEISLGTGLSFSGSSVVLSTNLQSLSSLSYSSASFVKMTAAGTFALDTNSYVSGSGASGQISFWSADNTQSGDANFIWDNTQKSFVVGAATVNSKAILELASTTKGFLPPRMTLIERNAITTPPAGLIIYQTTSPIGLYFYNGTAWRAMTSVAG